VLLKRAAGLKMDKKPGGGAKLPGKERVGKVSRKQVEEIVKIKMADFNCFDVDAGVKIISGTARSMGIDVTD
jgi:large subunit ribosomal protein L11